MAEEFAHPEFLVTPEWLHAHLNDAGVRVIDTRPAAKYEAGHIPGSALVDVYTLHCRETTPEGVRGFVELMEREFSRAGVGADQTVVFVGDDAGEWPARGLWALYWLGHDGARLLDGGLRAWEAAGYPLTTDAPRIQATQFKGRPRPAELATYEQVLAAIDNPQVDIVDTRRPTEYSGEEIRSPRGGRIPGTLHLEWIHNLDDAGKLKSARALTDQYAELGLQPGREVITYCQGGFRAAHTWLVLKMLGYPQVSNYIGSWYEWGRRDGLPIENLTVAEPKA